LERIEPGQGAPDVGTLRAEEKKSQIRKEQSRWKIGTASAWTGRGANGSSWIATDASAGSASVAEATASRSIPEEGHGEAGAVGARLLSAGFAQQAGVAQLAGS